jgi:hypothetical protein
VIWFIIPVMIAITIRPFWFRRAIRSVKSSCVPAGRFGRAMRAMMTSLSIAGDVIPAATIASTAIFAPAKTHPPPPNPRAAPKLPNKPPHPPAPNPPAAASGPARAKKAAKFACAPGTARSAAKFAPI